jgi:hypothetical protein
LKTYYKSLTDHFATLADGTHKVNEMLILGWIR